MWALEKWEKDSCMLAACATMAWDFDGLGLGLITCWAALMPLCKLPWFRLEGLHSSVWAEVIFITCKSQF